MGATDKAQIQEAHATLVGLIAEEVQAQPLHGVENDQGKPEKEQVDRGNRI
jgi:hypothetical protein